MLPWTLVNTTLTVVLSDGSAKTLNRSETPGRFDQAMSAIQNDEWEELEEIMCPVTHIDRFSEGHIQVVDGKLHIDNEEVPQALGQKIIDYSGQNLPYQPLVAFWRNLKLNPSYRAVQGLFLFLERNQFPITPLGNFIAYKGVNENWTDCRTGNIDNSVGKTVTMPRNKVNENPEETCSYGLHVANWDYAHTLYGGGKNKDGFGNGHTIMVEVNPKDVVAVPVDYNYAKMRVCEYRVLQEVFHQNTKELEDTFERYDTDPEGLGGTNDESYDECGCECGCEDEPCDDEWCSICYPDYNDEY